MQSAKKGAKRSDPGFRRAIAEAAKAEAAIERDPFEGKIIRNLTPGQKKILDQQANRSELGTSYGQSRRMRPF